MERLKDIPVLRSLSLEKGVSPQRIVLAWMMARSSAILPIPGASRVHNLEDSLGALDLRLSAEETSRISSQLN